MASGGLSQWFKEKWVDLSRPKEGGGYEPCGRPDADEGKYPKCVPASRAARMTEAEIKSAVRRKRKAESTKQREGKKPINVKTVVEKKNVPTNPELYAKVKAEAKRKFDVYPSAYANGWLVQEYKRRGGKYKTVAKSQDGLSKHLGAQHDQMTHGRRKTGSGLSAVREAARGTSLAHHRYSPTQVEGQLSFFTEEPYAKPQQAEYKTGIGTVKDDVPMPSQAESVSTDEEAVAHAKAIFDVEIELESGGKVIANVDPEYVQHRYDITVYGDIYDENGEKIGKFERTLNPDGYVYNSLFRIDPSHRGKGIGTALLRHWEDQYHQAGYGEMRVTASSGGGFNGAYTWLKYGYAPDYPQEIVAKYVGFIVTELAYDPESYLPIASDFLQTWVGVDDRSIEELSNRVKEGAGSYEFRRLAGDMQSLVFDRFWDDPLEIVSMDEGFSDFLKSGDIKWDGSKYTSPLFYDQYAKSATTNQQALNVINRWMTEDPAGLENDDPKFWQDIRDAYGKVSKHAEHDQKTHGRRKTARVRMRQTAGGKLRIVPDVPEIRLSTTDPKYINIRGPVEEWWTRGGQAAWSKPSITREGWKDAQEQSRELLEDSDTRDIYWQAFIEAGFMAGGGRRSVTDPTMRRAEARPEYYARRWSGPPRRFLLNHGHAVRRVAQMLGVRGQKSRANDIAHRGRDATKFWTSWHRSMTGTGVILSEELMADMNEDRKRQERAEQARQWQLENWPSLAKHAEHDQKTHGRRKSSVREASVEDWQMIMAKAQASRALGERPKDLQGWKGPKTFDERLSRCYELSWEAVMYTVKTNKLVHGSIHGPGGNERIPHAWVELNDGTIYDPVLDLWFSADDWVVGFAAEPAIKYSRVDAVEKGIDTGHMGPWHDAPYGNDWYEKRGA